MGEYRIRRDLDDVAISCFRELQFFLGLFPCGDIINDGDEMRWVTPLACEGDGQIGMDDAGVLADETFLHGVGLYFPGQQPFEESKILRKVIGMGDFLEVFLQEFRFRVAEDFTQLRVHPDPSSVEVRIGDSGGGEFEGRAESHLTLRKQFCILYPLLVEAQAVLPDDEAKPSARSKQKGSDHQNRFPEAVPNGCECFLFVDLCHERPWRVRDAAQCGNHCSVAIVHTVEGSGVTKGGTHGWIARFR